MKKKFFLIILSIPFLYANFNTAEVKSKYVAFWIQSLKNQNIMIRNNVAEKLILLGKEIIPTLIKNFNSDDYIVRRKKVYICGRIASKGSTEFLVKALEDKDSGVRNLAARMLLNMSDKYSLLDKLKNVNTTIPQVKNKIADLANSILYKEIEQEILYYVSPDGNSGYFTGQFAKLEKKWKHRAILPLLDIFKDDNYRYINTHIKRDEAFQMRFLAGEGLADLKIIYTENLRWKVKMDLTIMKRKLRTTQPNNEYLQGLIDFILYSIGYKKEFDKQIKIMKLELILQQKNSLLLYNLGMKYLRIRKLKEGIKYLKKAIAIDFTNDIYHYNLACAYSVARRIEEAIDSLEQSVYHGYKDVNWMIKDGDLRNIRKHPRFLKLIKKLKKEG